MTQVVNLPLNVSVTKSNSAELAAVNRKVFAELQTINQPLQLSFTQQVASYLKGVNHDTTTLATILKQISIIAVNVRRHQSH